MKNGRDDSHDDDPRNDPKIARIEDARRRRQLGLTGGAGSGKKSAGGGVGIARGNLKEWLIGGIIVAMAIGMIVSFGGTVLRAVGVLAR